MTSYISEAQAEGLRHAVSQYERARGLRLRWAGYGTLNAAQVRHLIEQTGVAALHDQIVAVEVESDSVRHEFERLAANASADRERAEAVQSEGVGSMPGSARYAKSFAAAKEIPALAELEGIYAEILSRPWPSAVEVRAGVAAVAGEVLAAIRQRAAAAAFDKLLPTRQAAEVVLGVLDRFAETSRAFDKAAGKGLAVAGWDPADVEALRRVAQLEFVRTDENHKEKS